MNQPVILRIYSKTIGIFLLAACIFGTSYAQVYSNKEVGKKNAELADSIKKSEYPYALPIWGAKAAKLGFNLPYSAGLSVQYLWQKSDLIIDNLQVGFNNGPLINLDEIVRFNNATSNAQGINIRPDIWVFPFLNVYGVVAKSKPSTQVDFGVYVPDSAGNWNNVANFETKADFEATTVGFGITPTIGIGGGFMALDMNFTWSDVPELAEPAFAFVFGPRFGKSFKLKRPEESVAVWVGGFRLKLNSGTTGSINLSELFDLTGLQGKVDNGIQAVGQKQAAVETWWDGLTPAQQQNPVNVAKYQTANRALGAAGNFLNTMDQALNDDQTASVQYSLDKRQKDMWNFIVGAQYSLNKSWMLRFEAGMLGARTQIITGLQWRFGL